MLRNQQASFKNLENQVGQIVKLLLERPQCILLSNIEANPHKNLKAITPRSGKEVGMNGDKVMEKEKEPESEVFEIPTKEKGATLVIKKSMPLAVKKHVLWLPYPSRLKNDCTDE